MHNLKIVFNMYCVIHTFALQLVLKLIAVLAKCKQMDNFSLNKYSNTL